MQTATRAVRMLFVDDALPRLAAVHCLRGLPGVTIRTAASHNEALAAFTEFRPDIVMCPIRLGAGCDFARLGTALRGKTRVVLMGTCANRTARLVARAFGINDIVVKPLNMLPTLLGLIGRAGELPR